MRRSLAVACVALSAACASTEVRRANRFDDLPPAGDDVAVRVAVPGDGSYDEKVYPGSGGIVAERIVDHLRERFTNVERGTADAGSVRVLEITPAILHWEDRATNWSGIRDRIRVELRLRDLPGDRQRLLVFAANNSWFTLVNNPPESLLDASFDAAVDELLPPRADG